MIKVTPMGSVMCICNECHQQNSAVSDEPKHNIFMVEIGKDMNARRSSLCGKRLFKLMNESWRHLFKPEYFDYAVM